MYPILFRIGPLEIRSYGFMLALSFLVGILLGSRRAEKYGIEAKFIYDLSVWLMLGAIIGARLFYVFFHLDEFAHNLTAIFNPFQDGHLVGIAGMNMYGGVIFAIAFGMIYMWKHQLPIWKISDILIPYLALGTAITRIGCFLNGCCFGNSTDCILGMNFPHDSIPGEIFHDHAIHPTQLYSSAFNFLLFPALIWIDKHKKVYGQTFWTWIVVYALFRFSIEFIRYYEDAMYLYRGESFDLTMNQGVAVLLAIFGIIMIVQFKKKPGLQVPSNV